MLIDKIDIDTVDIELLELVYEKTISGFSLKKKRVVRKPLETEFKDNDTVRNVRLAYMRLCREVRKYSIQ